MNQTGGTQNPFETASGGGAGALKAAGEDDQDTAVIDPPPAEKAPPKPAKRKRKKTAPPDRKAEKMPPWKVLLHNDDVNDMVYVVETIMNLTPLDFKTAYLRMMEAHTKGLTMLLATHKERAELYRDQFRSKHLKVTIEPDSNE